MIFLLIYRNKTFIFIFLIIKIIIINSVLKKILLLLKKVKKSVLFERSFTEIILNNIINLTIILI